MTLRLKKPSKRKHLGEKWGMCYQCGIGVAYDDSDYCARRYPESQLTWWKGRLLCTTHMLKKRHEMEDEHLLEIDEGDRGEPI